MAKNTRQSSPGTKPPGTVLDGATHGPQERLGNPSGEARLRKLLRLSRDVSLQRLCAEAADVIEELRTKK